MINSLSSYLPTERFRGGGDGWGVGKGYSDDVAMNLAYFIPSLYHTLQNIDDHAVISSHH